MTLPLNAMMPRVRKIFLAAAAEAEAAGQRYVGSESLLLALAADKDGHAAHLLDSLGVREQVEQAARSTLVEIGDDGRVGGNAKDEATVFITQDEATKYALKVEES